MIFGARKWQAVAVNSLSESRRTSVAAFSHTCKWSVAASLVQGQHQKTAPFDALGRQLPTAMKSSIDTVLAFFKPFDYYVSAICT